MFIRVWGIFTMSEEPLQTSKFSMKYLNRKGSVMVSALVMGIIVIIMIFSSSIYLRSRIQAVMASSDKMDNRIALDGMLAYTINGIKQSWCFTDTWTNQPSCMLTDARNTARLLISDESLAYIGSSTAIKPTPLSATRLDIITQKVDLTSINSNHPIYNIASPLNGKYKDVTFTIKRDDNAIATTKGREVRLRISIYVTATSGLKIDDLELESQVVVYPRELSYFGLIMPGNLYLGATTTALGDVGLNQYASASGKGLRFESPVFVNKNLYLPSATNTTPMKNVVFLDKVVLGGMLYQGASVYSPATAGGENSMYNHEMKSFAGLLGGYELDEGKDTGLEFLFGTAGSSYTVSGSDYERCLQRIQASYDLKVTKNSQLFMRYNSTLGLNIFNLSANIGNIDNLIEQDVGTGPAFKIQSDVSNSDPTFVAGTVDKADGGAVFKVRVVFTGLKPTAALPRNVYASEFYLSRSGSVTLYPQGLAAAPRMKISASPFHYGDNDQFNQVTLDVQFTSSNNLDMAPFGDGTGVLPVQDSIKVFIEGQDYAYNVGRNLRDPTNATVTEPILGIYKSNGVTFNRRPDGFMDIAQSSTTWSTNEVLNSDLSGNFKLWEGETPILRDWAALDAACMAAPETGSTAFYASFPSANWGTSFAQQSSHAWRFSPEYPGGRLDGVVTFDGSANRFDAGAGVYPTFSIRSVIRDCVIASTANFVSGFYTCETLTISPRTEPLRIIGTFITGKLTIADSAYAAGIRWSTIYQPQALYELRAAKILGKYKDGSTVVDCNNTALPPLWAPNLGVTSALAHYLCNPVSLRTADPFKWTMVDPDCGIDPTVDPMKVACKSQPRRFLIKEISRMKGL
jgi:hypothetical protein